MKLPDLNVWLAAAWAGHSDHDVAKDWFDRQTEALGFCRVTQMGLLRLISNPAIMGKDALDRRESWDVYQRLRMDPRVEWLSEPSGLDAMWMQHSRRPDRAHKLWTDDYLAAFAFLMEAHLVTFDQALALRHPASLVEALCSPL
jgi:uncharacterized protein